MPIEIYSHKNHENFSKDEIFRALLGVARELQLRKSEATSNYPNEINDINGTDETITITEYLNDESPKVKEWIHIVGAIVTEQGRNYDTAIGGVDPDDLYFPSILMLDDVCSNTYIDPKDWLTHQPVLGGIAVSVNRLLARIRQAKNTTEVNELFLRLHDEYFEGLTYINRGFGIDEYGFEVFGANAYYRQDNPRGEDFRDVRHEFYNQGAYSVKVLYAYSTKTEADVIEIDDKTISIATKWLHRLASFQYTEEKQNILDVFRRDLSVCGLKPTRLKVMPPVALVGEPKLAGKMVSKIDPETLFLKPIIFKTNFSRDEEKIGSNILDMLTVMDTNFIYGVRDSFQSSDLEIAEAIRERSVSVTVAAYFKEFDWIWNYPVAKERFKQLKILQKELNQKLVADLLDHLNASKQ